jgi:choline-sulfatase
MLTRRTAVGTIAAPFVLRSAPRKPNFLFIIADDHAGYVLGADGDRNARTPNLDRFARSGVRFSQHFCNSPVCTPSRQGLITGQLPHSAGVTRLPTPLDTEKPTLPKQFKKAGYTTAVFGKMHFNRPGVAGLHGFDEVTTEDVLNRRWREEVKPRPLPEDVAVKPAWKPFQDPARIWLNAAKLPFGRYDQDMRSSFEVRLVEEYLDQRRSDPFALWVSFIEPHSPFDFPMEYRARFDARKFQPPRVGPEDAWQIPNVFRDLTADEKRGIAAAYYTSVEFLDRNIGRVLKKMEDLGLAENTVIVYTADHGYHLGQHGRFEKHCGFDPALRVPLIVRDPRNARPRVVNSLTEHVDLTATIIDLMGLEKLPVQHGTSLRPWIEGESGGPRDHVFSEYLENEEAFIRTPRWKLIYCSGRRARGDGYITDTPTPGRYTRLYDLKSDPGEFTNVAERHPEVVRGLKSLLLERFLKTHAEAEAVRGSSQDEDALDFFLRPRDV